MKKLEASINAIKAAGFSHLKLELEGQLARHGRFSEPDDCEDWMWEKLSDHAKRVINYKKFYYDGSVDSELTFTFPVEEIAVAVEVINVWNQLVEANGNGCDVNGAGMHFSVLTTGRYPCSTRLPEANLRNYMTEVTKLLPALFLGAMSGNFTRALGYRYPRVSMSDKYSAIYIKNGTSIEYRLFETCYQRPEAVYEYLGVIARTLEYFTDVDKKVIASNQTYEILEAKGIEGYIALPDQIRILKKQIKHIVPEGMTAREFLEARGIKLLVKAAVEGQSGRVKKLSMAYDEHKKAHDKVMKEPLNQYQLDNVAYWKSQEPNKPEIWYWERVTGRRAKIEPRKQYIKNNLKTAKTLAQLSV